ncbi:hypothetical protein ACJRO7_028446 [Eucalyptus globulus]|uniref:Uncharacterized protein n=1 Tax=Eucalyptus globulus TaxID=34317 RepID=A0ABD3K4D3_EUCGL
MSERKREHGARCSASHAVQRGDTRVEEHFGHHVNGPALLCSCSTVQTACMKERRHWRAALSVDVAWRVDVPNDEEKCSLTWASVLPDALDFGGVATA